MQIKNTNDGCLLNYISETKASDRVKARFFIELFTLIIALIALIYTIYVHVSDYNHRYNTDAQSSGGFVFTLSSGAEQSGTFTAFAGTITYGCFQKEGATPTQYRLGYKVAEDYNDHKILRTITANRNGDCIGYYKMTSSFYTRRYALYCERLEDGRNDTTTIEVDWGVK